MYDAVNAVFPPEMPRQYETQQMNIAPFHRKLEAALAPNNITVPIQRDSTEPEGTLLLSGMWYARGPIEIRMHLHTATHRVKWTPAIWKRRRMFFWETVMHELIHRYQGSAEGERFSGVYYYSVDEDDPTRKEELEYYGECDEIEAYAHDAAVELFTWYPTSTLAGAIRQVATRRSTGMTRPAYTVYTRVFEHNKHNPALQQFHRKLRSWWNLVHAESDFYRSLELA